MNPIKNILGISILLLLATTPAFAGGIYLSEIGTPISVGTAGVANVTNTKGADSVYTNPAGMTGIDSVQIIVGSQVVIPTLRFDSDIATAGGSDGGNAGSVVSIPSLFAVKPLNNDWRLGLAISIPSGGGVNYGKDFVGRYQAQKSELAVIGISPAVAYRVNDKLSLGAGVSFLYTSMDLHVAVNQPGPSSSDGQIKMDELDDWAYQGFIGATYKATDRLTFGVVYRTKADTELEGDIKFKNITVPPLNELTSKFNKAQIDFTYPQLVKVGVKYKLTDDTVLMADFDWEEWSAFGDTRIGLSGDGSALQSFDRDWDDTWHLGFALAHKLSENQSITAGIGYDSSPVSDSKRTADLPADEQLRLSTSYVRKISEHLGMALGGTFLWLGEGKMDQVVQGERFKGEFSTNHIIFLSATVKYVF
ncbi:MAG: outer membrane protein transport protein [Desulfuromusa sp.]|nr:outer membrane protein transport protein [Desulfuromusa sp.]